MWLMKSIIVSELENTIVDVLNQQCTTSSYADTYNLALSIQSNKKIFLSLESEKTASNFAMRLKASSIH